MDPTTLTEALRHAVANTGVAAVREGRRDAAATLHNALWALEAVPGRPLVDWAEEWLQPVLAASNLDPCLVDLADYVEALTAHERRPAIMSAVRLPAIGRSLVAKPMFHSAREDRGVALGDIACPRCHKPWFVAQVSAGFADEGRGRGGVRQNPCQNLWVAKGVLCDGRSIGGERAHWLRSGQHR
jgi:hypothetical protein